MTSMQMPIFSGHFFRYYLYISPFFAAMDNVPRPLAEWVDACKSAVGQRGFSALASPHQIFPQQKLTSNVHLVNSVFICSGRVCSSGSCAISLTPPPTPTGIPS